MPDLSGILMSKQITAIGVTGKNLAVSKHSFTIDLHSLIAI